MLHISTYFRDKTNELCMRTSVDCTRGPVSHTGILKTNWLEENKGETHTVQEIQRQKTVDVATILVPYNLLLKTSPKIYLFFGHLISPNYCWENPRRLFHSFKSSVPKLSIISTQYHSIENKYFSHWFKSFDSMKMGLNGLLKGCANIE